MTERVDLEQILAAIEPHCDGFEDALAEGREPRIEDYLQLVEESWRAALFEELLALEAHFAGESGKDTSAGPYFARFPDHAKTIARVLRLETAGGAVSPLQFQPGETLGPYTILREIGRGGMGVVYEARHDLLDRAVALKLLSYDGQETEQAEARFQREARAIARLHHSNIVPVFDFGTLSGVDFFAMQLIEGESLAQEIRGRSDSAPEGTVTREPKRRDLERRLRQAIEIARALQFAHDQGVIHRDVKPSNILIDLHGSPWLVDFGVAHVEESDLTQASDLLGTLRYMAPERFSGISNPQSDVYSLGVTLFEALTDEPVFSQSDPALLMRQIVDHPPPRIRQSLRNAPWDLETVLSTAMASDPRERYAAARDFADDLERVLADVPVLARRPGPIERAWRWARRNRAASLALVLLAALAASSTLLSRHLSQRNKTVTELSKNVGELLEASEADGQNLRYELYRSDMQRLSLEIFSARGTASSAILDRWIPKDGEPDLRGWEWHVLRSSIGEESELMRYRSSAGDCVDWCPATRQLAVAGDSGVRIIDFDSRVQIAEFGGFSHPKSVRFNPSGTRLLVGDMSRAVALDLESGEVMASQALRSYGEVNWIGDGPRALILSPGPTIWNVDSDVLKEVEGLEWSNAMTAISPDGRLLATLGNAAELQIIDFDSMAVLRRLDLRGEAPKGLLPEMRFSSCGKYLAAHTGGRGLRIWDWESGICTVRVEHAHDTLRCSIQWSEDGKHLVTSGLDSIVKVWNTATGQLERTLRGHIGDVRGSCFVDEGRTVVSTSDSGDTRYWDLSAPPGHTFIRTGQIAGSWRMKRLRWTAGDAQIQTLWSYGLTTWNLDEGTPRIEEVEPFGYPFLSPDGSMELIADKERLHLIDRSTGEDLFGACEGEAFTSPLSHAHHLRIEWSPDSQRIYIANRALGWVIRDLRGDPSAKPATKDRPFIAFSLDPKGRRMSVESDRSLFVLDAATGEVIKALEPADHAPNYPNDILSAFGPPGSPLAFTWGPQVILFEPVTLGFLRTLDCHSDSIYDLQWSPDGSRIAVATADYRVRILDPTRGLVASFDCPVQPFAIAWDSKGERLIALDSEGDFHLWDARASLARPR